MIMISNYEPLSKLNNLNDHDAVLNRIKAVKAERFPGDLEAFQLTDPVTGEVTYKELRFLAKPNETVTYSLAEIQALPDNEKVTLRTSTMRNNQVYAPIVNTAHNNNNNTLSQNASQNSQSSDSLQNNQVYTPIVNTAHNNNNNTHTHNATQNSQSSDSLQNNQVNTVSSNTNTSDQSISTQTSESKPKCSRGKSTIIITKLPKKTTTINEQHTEQACSKAVKERLRDFLKRTQTKSAQQSSEESEIFDETSFTSDSDTSDEKVKRKFSGSLRSNFKRKERSRSSFALMTETETSRSSNDEHVSIGDLTENEINDIKSIINGMKEIVELNDF